MAVVVKSSRFETSIGPAEVLLRIPQEKLNNDRHSHEGQGHSQEFVPGGGD